MYQVGNFLNSRQSSSIQADAFTTSPFPLPPALMPQTSFLLPHAPLPFSLARSQPASALPLNLLPWSIPSPAAGPCKCWS